MRRSVSIPNQQLVLNADYIAQATYGANLVVLKMPWAEVHEVSFESAKAAEKWFFWEIHRIDLDGDK